MTDQLTSKLDESRAQIEAALRQYQGWGLAILRERKAELEQAIIESGGSLPALTTGEGESDLWYASSNN
jgi:hypothetical protein